MILDEFLARLPAELRASAGDDVAVELAEVITRARAEVPEVALDPSAFAGYLAERVTFDSRGRPVLRSLHAGDLWIAFGCVSGHPGALAVFEVRFVREIRSALRRSFEPGLAEDAEAQLLEKLVLVADDASPRLASYAGRGALLGWLRAAAIRCAIDRMRARREVPVDPHAVGELAGAVDPLLASLKQRYRDEFRGAFADAAEQLTDRERTLLRYRFLDDLSIDEIGTLYRVHRATVARWIAAIRESLFEGTRARLVGRLDLSESEVDSVLRLIDSQLDVSIERVFAT